MSQRHLSESLRDLYSTLKIYAETGKEIPAPAVPLLLKVTLTARFMAEELEDELALAERIMNANRRPADFDRDQENVVTLPFRPRVIPSSPGGGDAA